jgi:hypothetical protein
MSSLNALESHPLASLNAAATVKRDDGLSAPLFRARLCGTLAERVVILEGLEPLPFQVGERLVVQANLRGQAIGFVTTVIGQAERPSPHWFLNFPDGYEELELRKSARVPALIPVRIELGSGPPLLEVHEPVDGVLINVSQTGCALSSLRAFGPNQSLTLGLTLPGRPGEYRLAVTVVSRKDPLPLHVHGARFDSRAQPAEPLRALREWVARQQTYCPMPAPLSRPQG